MKVTSKSEMPSVSPSQDASSSSPSGPVDFLYLIMQMASQSEKPGEKKATSELLSGSEAKPKEETEALNNTEADILQILAQINLVNQTPSMPVPPSPAPPSPAPEVKLPEQLGEAKPTLPLEQQVQTLPKTSLELPPTELNDKPEEVKQLTDVLLKTNPDLASSLAKNLQSRDLQTREYSDPMINSSEEPLLPGLAEALENSIPKSTDPKLNQSTISTIDVLAKTGKDLKQIGQTDVKTNNPNALHSKNAALEGLNAPVPSQVQSNSEIVDKTISDALAKKSEKYTQVFNQIGVVINTQTTKSMMNEMVKPANNTVSANVKEKSIVQPQIELLPPTIDSLNKEIYSAKIRIYPPELGHVLANIRADKNNVELTMWTQNEQVKAIVESNLAQLRDRLLNSDINLTNVQVHTMDTSTSNSSNSNPSNQQSQAEKFTNNTHQEELDKISVNSASNAKDKSSDGIIDTYA